MKTLSTLGWLAMLALTPWSSTAHGQKLLLHVPFDESLEARNAAGEPKGTFHPPAKSPDSQPRFLDGIVGKALDIGTGCRVDYAVAGNLQGDRGTVSFWAKRAGPKPEGRYTFHLGGWGNKDGSWVLLYRWEWHGSVNMLHGLGGSGDVGLQLPGDGDDGEWHFFAFTWDGHHARGYMDGATDSAAEKRDFPAQHFSSFWVGGGDQTSRLIDELKIFDEPLGISEIKALYREVAGVRTEPALIIPRRTSEVRMDGRLELEEWAPAATTTGLIGIETKMAAPTPTLARLMYDDEALLVAFDSGLPEKARRDFALSAGITGILRQTRDRFDTDVDADDAVEINVMPRPPAGPQDSGGDWFRLVLNGLNTHYDYSITPGNVISLDWNPAWTSASTLDAEGWHVEIRLPFAAFGVPAPRPGDRWGLNLFRLWQALQSGREAWAVAPGLTPGYRYAVSAVQFGGPDALTVRLADWGPLHDNLVAVHGEVANPGQQPATASVSLSSDSGECRDVRLLKIASGAAASFGFDFRLQDPATSLLTLAVTDEGRKEVCFRSQAPISRREVLEIRSAHFPSAGIFKVFVDAGRLRGTPLKQLSCRLALLDENGKRTLPVKKLQPLPGYVCEAEMNVASLEPGKYRAVCRIEREGKLAAEKSIALEKRPPPEWLGNTIGLTDNAPKPFTPVRRRGDSLSCWGREYRFDHQLFPAQIVTRNSEILAGPIHLRLTDGSGREFDSASVPAEAAWGKATDFRQEFERSIQLGKVKVRVSCWLECDGFLWTTLRLPPSSVSVGHLVVSVPLKKEWAEYINPYDYSTVNTGKLKPEGWKGGGQPLWLGNGEGGLQFTTETLAPCRLKPETHSLRVIPGEAATALEITLINVPTKLQEGFEVSWGWVSTPVRPPTPGYRGWMTQCADTLPGYQWYWPPGSEFDPRWLGYSHFVGPFDRPDGKGKGLSSGGPYVVTTMCPAKVPEFEYWGDEWSPSMMGRRVEGGMGQCSVAARSWVDFFVWCYRQTYKRGRYIGLYYDCAPYLQDDNFHHGGGLKIGGRVHPTGAVLGAREIAKRLYCQLRELEPEQTMVLYHNSGQIDMAFLSWCDVFVDGENFTSRLSKVEQDYHRLFPPEAFLAQSMGHNFGLNNWFLDEFNRSGATNEEDWKRLGVQPVTHLYGLILLHDGGYWKAYGNPQGYERVDGALRKYSFDERYRMIPYWRQKVVTLPEKVFATFYRDDAAERVLVILLNNNENDLQLRLKLNWPELGFGDWRGLKVDDAVFLEGASIEDGELVTPIGCANMRLLAIEKQ
ncbi:MAG: hypothetical protein HYU36_05255 [Planctomycetes bacterium]|nr:hypothetical protein [Planctomycetota bacterium]